MDEPLAAIDAVRRGKILWFASHGALERRFPAEAGVPAPWESTGLVPLVGREGPLGLLTLQFRERRPRRRDGPRAARHDRPPVRSGGGACAAVRARARRAGAREPSPAADGGGLGDLGCGRDRGQGYSAAGRLCSAPRLASSFSKIRTGRCDRSPPTMARRQESRPRRSSRACPWQRQYEPGRSSFTTMAARRRSAFRWWRAARRSAQSASSSNGATGWWRRSSSCSRRWGGT